MKLGFHISIAGGFKYVCTRAKQTASETIQVFSRNPRSWKYKAIDDEDSAIFKKQIIDYGIGPVFVHLPYLNKLGSSNDILYERSIASLMEDLKRAEKLNAEYLITHSGSNLDIKSGIKKMIEAIIKALSHINNNVIILVENTAGSGNEFGYNFEQLGEIIKGVNSNRIGIVFDTAHAFAAGYELRTDKGVNETIRSLEKFIGLEHIYLIHFNDSLAKLGSKRDRHWHIGKGEIGKGMEFIINHPAFKHHPFIMETPRTGIKEDLLNMATARKMIRNS
uniref:Probable endonuclease 4 n=1 Tax=candidate division WOR-3 bacterium TaxID=2052148 RepID=A0A7C6EKR4_UNCW3